MIHEMRLYYQPFYEIKMGRNTKEVRVNDSKRKKVNVGDYIIFKKRPDLDESVKVKVIAINRYSDYLELLNANKNLKNITLDYYSKEDQTKYGFVVFDIKVVK